VSTAAALAAWALARATGREPYGVEMVLRGALSVRVEHGRRLRVGRNVTIVAPENCSFGEDVTLYGNTWINAGGEDGRVRIGDRTHLDQFCVLSGLGGIEIGAGCAISSRCVVYSQSNGFDPGAPVLEQPIRKARVTLGEDVLIGASVTILPGVTVGDHAVVGAGAVVREDVPAWAIVAGVPARVIGDRRERAPTAGPRSR
jgi:acetyltransferase-like isoleucine patch superfamily enzyme